MLRGRTKCRFRKKLPYQALSSLEFVQYRFHVKPDVQILWVILFRFHKS